MDNITYSIEEIDAGKRLDVFIAAWQEISRNKAQEMIADERIFCNGLLMKKASRALRIEDVIAILPSQKIEDVVKEVEAVDTKEVVQDVTLIFEADEYIVVEKPAGMLTHPTDAKEINSLTTWLTKHCPEIVSVGDNPEVRPGIVHRLDKAASGVLVVAKNQEMFDVLKDQFRERTVDKEYIVLVHGVIEGDSGTIDFSIDRGKDGLMVARPRVSELTLKNIHTVQPGKDALTEFHVEKRFAHYTLLRVKIHTGRTHQIRVHMHAYGHPVVGDMLYYQKQYVRKSALKLDRLFLHARKLCLRVDEKEEKQCFEAPLPDELNEFLVSLSPLV
jgi:23S rRNA pseudouridine1911/1915/1917 synthase